MQLSADDWPDWPEHHQADTELHWLVAVFCCNIQVNCWCIRHHAKPRAVAHDRVEGSRDAANVCKSVRPGLYRFQLLGKNPATVL